MKRTPATTAFWRGRLPHWEVEEGRYFVTMHLAGAIPPQGHQRIHELAAQFAQRSASDGEDWLILQRNIFAEMEQWLDRAPRASLLGRKDLATMVAEAIVHRQNCDWKMFEFVVMPSHIHLFFELMASPGGEGSSDGKLRTVLEGFRRWTGHQAAKLAKLPQQRFWQDEWFDHWSRSDEEDDRIVAYIRNNPVKANLVTDYQLWPYGGWCQ